MDAPRQELITAAEYNAQEHLNGAERQLAAIRQYAPIDDESIAGLYAAELVLIKRALKALDESEQEHLAPWAKLLAELKERYARPRRAALESEAILKRHVGAWEAQKKRLADERARQAELEAEQKREQLRKQAAQKQAAARAELDAGNHARAGELALDADATRGAAESLPAVLEPPPARLPGITNVTRWKARLVSEESCRAFVSTHPEFNALFQFSQSAADQFARSLKNKLRIPGLEAVPVTSPSVRT